MDILGSNAARKAKLDALERKAMGLPPKKPKKADPKAHLKPPKPLTGK